MKSNKRTNKRKQYGPEFKSRVAVAAIKGDKTLNELAGIYEVHPSQIAQWKRQAVSQLPEVFRDGRRPERGDWEAERAELYQQIGQMKVELDWLKKKVLG